MNGLGFKIIRSMDKEFVKEQILEQIKVGGHESHVDYADMRYSTFVRSMRKIAKMREIADEAEVGFAAFFKGPSGKRYYISNLNHWAG